MKRYIIARIDKETNDISYYNGDWWQRPMCILSMKNEDSLFILEKGFLLNIFNYRIYEVTCVKMFNT